jgi:hypothetical protein
MRGLVEPEDSVLWTDFGVSKADWSVHLLDDELGEALRAELLSWPGVTVRPVMGTLGYFRGQRQLGYYANREPSKKKPAWLNQAGEPLYACVRLRLVDAQCALKRPGVLPARLGFAGWVDIPLTSRDSLEESVRCFGTAYERPPRSRRRIRKGRTWK